MDCTREETEKITPGFVDTYIHSHIHTDRHGIYMYTDMYADRHAYMHTCRRHPSNAFAQTRANIIMRCESGHEMTRYSDVGQVAFRAM